jgi:hypothetical protein
MQQQFKVRNYLSRSLSFVNREGDSGHPGREGNGMEIPDAAAATMYV